MSWLLGLFADYRQLQRELDDARREAGHWKAEASKWESRCETARRELMDELRGVNRQPNDEDEVEIDFPPHVPSEPIKSRGIVHGRELVKRRTSRFIKAQADKFRQLQ